MLRSATWFGKTAFLLVSCALVVAVGCGDGTGLSKRYKVGGNVTYKGAPVEKGEISFKPVDPNLAQAATSVIENGSYQLTTAVKGDGAFPGEYTVTITSKNVDLTQATANAGGGSLRQDDVAKANKDAKDNIPSKYSLAETSNLKFTVEKKSNTANFELTD